MKTVKTTKTYKYEYKNWTQPVFSSNELTENGVWYKLTVSAGESTAWKAFDGDTTTNQQCWWTGKVSVTESNPAWIQLECDYKLKLTSVDIMNEKYQPENPKTGFIQVSDDGMNWKNVGTFTGTNSSSYVTTVPLTVTEGYRFYRVYFTATWGEGVSLQEITYTGQIATETRQSGIKTLAVKQTVLAKGAWRQPILTSNSQDGIVVTASGTSGSANAEPYKALDGVKSGTPSTAENGWNIGTATTGWWQVTFPYKLKITKLVRYNNYLRYPEHNSIKGQFFTNSSKTTPIGEAINVTNETNWFSQEIIPSSPVITNTIYFAKTGGDNYSGIGELDIIAQKVDDNGNVILDSITKPVIKMVKGD